MALDSLLDGGDGSGEGSIEENALSHDEILKLLGDDSDDDGDSDDDDKDKDDDEDLDDGKDKDDDDEDVDDDKDKDDDDKKKLKLKDDDEDENKDEDDDDLKIITPVRRQEILKKYPKLFKDFPHLEKSSYRDQQFTEMFSTLEDAKEVLEKAETLDTYETELAEGDTSSIIKAVKANDEEAFNKLVDEYMPSLRKVDENAYFHVIGGVIKNAIISMVSEGKKTGNKQLNAAAQLVNQFVFGTSEFSTHENLSSKGSDKDDKLETEKEEFLRERFEIARDDLDTRIHNVLKSTIDDAIDPKESMSAFVKKHAVTDAMTLLESAIRSDPDFMKVLDGLWKKASGVKFNVASTKRIRGVYLSKAKTLLPAVIKRSRRDALKGTRRPGKSNTQKSSDRENRLHRRRASSSGNRPNDGKGMSTLDFLNQD